ncbi:hypothetical protein QTG56_25600 (plasmid) [Rossellomorea sp. AcN35-11]|nr:hypothetical protein QTG56_25600 [Rossellomorea sp. AcN35-11]
MMTFQSPPTIVEYDVGTFEKNGDTLEAKCNKCGYDWLIVYL